MPAAPKAPLVFIAEDDAAVSELVRTRLEIAGFRTAWSSSGRDAFEQCSQRRPDALILDVNLPGLDGFTILERWRSMRITAPPTLMLTARHSASDVQRAILLGARDYLTKPFDDVRLIARVTRLLRTPKPLAPASLSI